jgi:hypothetical protein
VPGPDGRGENIGCIVGYSRTKLGRTRSNPGSPPASRAGEVVDGDSSTDYY